MKINDLSTLGNMVRAGTVPEPRASSAASAPTFRAAMQGINRHNAEQVLSELSQRITEQGAILARRCDILELKRYKELITEYLYEAVRFMYEFKKQNTFDARGRHRLYAMIRRINEKLEKMTQDILGGQADGLELLSAIDEVRGLLIDVFQ